jgi:hypothetical protein
MEYGIAFQRVSEDISRLLVGLLIPSTRAVRAAAQAKRDLESALSTASGRPNDARWTAAIASLEEFLDLSSESRGQQCMLARRKLQHFVEENADAVPGTRHLQRAS